MKNLSSNQYKIILSRSIFFMTTLVLVVLFIYPNQVLSQSNLQDTKGIVIDRDNHIGKLGAIYVGQIQNQNANSDLQNNDVNFEVITLCGADVNTWIRFSASAGDDSIDLELRENAFIPSPDFSNPNRNCISNDCNEISNLPFDPLNQNITGSCANISSGFRTNSFHDCYCISVDWGFEIEEYFICVYGDPLVLAIDPVDNTDFFESDDNVISDEPALYEIDFDEDPSVLGIEFKAVRGGEALIGDSYKWDVSGVNENYIQFFNLDNPAPIVPENDAITGESYLRLEFTLDSDILPANSEESFTLSVEAPNGDTDERTFTIKNITEERSPVGVDIVYAIDISGSMNNKAMCSAGMSKLDYLKEQIIPIMKELSELQINEPGNPKLNNRYAFVFFSTDANADKQIAGYKEFIPHDQIDDFLEKFGDQVSAGGMTSIGAGIETAYNLIENNKRQGLSAGEQLDVPKYIIVLTNGKQNTEPLIQSGGGEIYIDITRDINDEDECFIGKVPDPADLTIKELKDKNIHLRIISFFEEKECYRSLLREASNNPDSYFEVLDICEGMTDVELIPLNEMDRNGSPKIVLRRTAVMNGTHAHELLNVEEEDVDKIVIGIRSTGTNRLSGLTVTKDGINYALPANGGIVQPDPQNMNYLIFSITSSIADPIDLKGIYSIEFNSDKPNITYNITGIVDDMGLHHRTGLGNIRYRAGIPMRLDTRIILAGSPIANNKIDSVIAFIQIPKKSWGKILSKQKVPSQYIEKKKDIDPKPGNGKWIKSIKIIQPSDMFFEQGISLSEKRFQVLYEKTNLLEKLSLWETVEVPLTYDKLGIWRASFSNTTSSGIYPVTFRIKGSSGDSFLRVDAQETYIDFGKTDENKSSIRVWDENVYILSVKPKDIYGNFLGPGNANEIEVKLSSGGVSGPTDYLDGRYIFRLINTSLKENPELTLIVKDDVVFKKSLSKLMNKFKFSLEGGLAIPMGNLSNTYKPGYLAEGRLGVRIYRQLFLNLEGGTYNFSAINTGDDDVSIYGGGIGAQYIMPIRGYGSGWNVHADATVGYYQYDNLDWEFGYNANLGISTTLTPNIAFILETGYYQVQTQPDVSDFWGILGGFRFSF